MPDGSLIFAFAHDLRGYLRTSLTRIQLAKQELAEDSQGLQWLRESELAAKSGGRLLDAMVAFSDVRHSEETIALSLLIRGVLLELKKSLEAASVLVSETPKVQVPYAVQAVLRELLDNSVKFQDFSRPLEIRIDCSVEVSGCVRVVVTDNGTGVEIGMEEKIFLPFERLHDRTRYPGFGLGLAHNRKVVEIYGGKIVAASSNPGGLRVEISLPEAVCFGASIA